ncbi:hypothetical protein Hanom_Chr06g00521621 [Helianthus anomalus]
MVAEIHANKAEMEATNEAKVCAASAILQARIKIAQEVMDPSSERYAFDVAARSRLFSSLPVMLNWNRCRLWRLVRVESRM